MNLLLDLAQSIRDSLVGSVGMYYWQQKREEIEKIVSDIISNYIDPVKSEIDLFLELRQQKEFSQEVDSKMVDLVHRVKNDFKDILDFSMQQFYNYSGKVVFLYGVGLERLKDNLGVSIRLANLLEEEGQFRKCIQILR